MQCNYNAPQPPPTTRYHPHTLCCQVLLCVWLCVCGCVCVAVCVWLCVWLCVCVGVCVFVCGCGCVEIGRESRWDGV